MEISLNMLIEWKNLFNEIIEDSSKEISLVERVLYTDKLSDEIVLIDIYHPKALPLLRRYSEVKDALSTGNAKILKKDPYDFVLRSDDKISKAAKKCRDEAWQFFEPLIANEDIEFMLKKDVRGEKISTVSKELGQREATYWVWLRKWWQRGRCKNTLLPDFQKCGGKGESRTTDNQNEKKLGRHPRNQEFGENPGIRITPEIEKKFEKGTKKFRDEQKHSLRDTFELIKLNYFKIDTEEINGINVPILPADEQLPTFEQYRYWYEKTHHNKKHIITDIYSERDYLNNKRPILGDATQMAFGPGSICQFDSTISNTYLTSMLNPIRIVGRPVTYLGGDTFSHVIMGFSSTFEGPSWKGAMLALDNIAMNKVEFCAKYGIPIDEEDWPCQLFIEGILIDRGEMRAYKAEPFIALGCRIYTTSPWRGDLKPIVERHHGRAEEKHIKFVPGYVPHQKQRGDPDYMLKAAVNIYRFRQLLILYIIEYNNFAYLKDYKKDVFMIAAQVKRYPLDIWNWGIKYRSGHLRVVSQDMIRLNLLPRKTVPVTPRGIHFEKELYYTCDLAIKEGWFERCKGKSMRVEVAFHPDSTDMIYLPLEAGTRLEPCFLTQASQHLKGQNWYDARDYFALEADAEKYDTTKRKRKKASLHAQKEAILEEGLEQHKEALIKAGKMSKKSRKEDIRLNRQIEKLIDNPLMNWLPNQQDTPSNNQEVNESEQLNQDDEYISRPSRIDALRRLQEEN
jgi:hypothetical protein